MRKLNPRKVRWIVKAMEKRELSCSEIAGLQGITARHARGVYAKYKGVKEPVLLACGRKPEPVTSEQASSVLEARAKHPFGAVRLARVLASQGVAVSHHKVHAVLKANDLACDEPGKQRQRKWVRFEREHSNELWHADYHELLDGKQLIAFLDDASRLITAWGVFDNASAENAVLVLDKAVKNWGKPKQVLTDNGSHFASVERESCPEPGLNAFQERLLELGVEHVRCRPHHPQTNGKLERWFYTLDKLAEHFGSLERAIEYYNLERPHMSLDTATTLKTPSQAFQEKMH